MEGLRINELLVNGYFKTKTARSKSPSGFDRYIIFLLLK